MPELARTTVQNAKVQAFIRPILAPPPKAFCGGPVLDAPEFQKLRQHRWGHVGDGTRPDEEYGAHIAGEVAYAGPMLRHFGHFVAEGIHRIVPARHYLNAKRFLFVAPVGDDELDHYDKLPGYTKDILRYLEIADENCIILNQSATVENLLVAQQGGGIGMPAHPDYLDLLRDYSTDKLLKLHDESLPSKKVYVCGKKDSGGNILGAAYVEQMLEDAGFWLFRPEDHPFSFQLYVYQQAETLIFSEGSAIHGTSLLGRDMMNNVSIVVRRPGAAGNFRNELLGRCKQLSVGFCCSYLGTGVTDIVSGQTAHHLGVSIYNIQSLKQFFIFQGINSFFGFDKQRYFDHCEADLLEYMKYCLSGHVIKRGSASFAEIFSRFELCKTSDIN